MYSECNKKEVWEILTSRKCELTKRKIGEKNANVNNEKMLRTLAKDINTSKQTALSKYHAEKML